MRSFLFQLDAVPPVFCAYFYAVCPFEVDVSCMVPVCVRCSFCSLFSTAPPPPPPEDFVKVQFEATLKSFNVLS